MIIRSAFKNSAGNITYHSSQCRIGVVTEIIRLQGKKEKKKCIFTYHQVKLWNSLPLDSANTKKHKQTHVLIMKMYRKEPLIEAKLVDVT